MTYQEKNFFNLLEEFKKEKLYDAQMKENTFVELRNKVIAKFPRDSIISMKLSDYLISSKNNSESFCRQINSILKNFFDIDLSKKDWENIFGIAIKNGTQIKVSKEFETDVICDNNKVFEYIKKQIVVLLEETDKNNYSSIESCELHKDFKIILMVIYCPEKVLPVCNINLLHRYCEAINLSYDYGKEMTYYSNLLIQWKAVIPVLSDWSYSKFVSFCDWLYRKDRRIDGNLLRQKEQIKVNLIMKEIESLNLCGKSKKAIVKVRVNQGVFRKKLLQHSKSCCLCNVSNPKLLIASHIKPWSACNTKEKLDKDNGFLMCPNHDCLFDQGWITFDDNGKIIISDTLSEKDRMAFNVNENMIILLTDENKKYLRYHREEIFEKFLP